MTMDWQLIVVGVDDSAESAAALGLHLAEWVGVQAHLIHGVQDPGAAFAARVMHLTSAQLEAGLLELLGPRLRAALGKVPLQALNDLAIRIGRPAAVLEAAVQELGAGLGILGGKHHLALGRWLGGARRWIWCASRWCRSS
jgi:hypothetical protein